MLPYLLILLLAIGQPQLRSVSLRPAERQLLYAEQLFSQQAYESSSLEFKRFLFYHPDTDRADFARYRIAQSYYYQGERAHAQKLFTDFMETYPHSPLYLHAQLMLGRVRFDAKDYSAAQVIFFQVVNAAPLSPKIGGQGGEELGGRVAAQAQYLRGWCHLYERNWLKAIAELRKVRQFQPETPLSLTATQLADTTLASTPLPLKSPRQAQWMSTFLPGSGQLYAGKVRNGLISAVINAAFLYLLVDSIREERYVDAVGIGWVGSRFYWGGRYSAKQWTIEHNRRIEEDFIRQLKGQSEGIERMLSLPELEIR